MTNGQIYCHVRKGVTLVFKLAEESVIGRDKGIAVSLPVEGVSRRHARIKFDGKIFWLEDLKSTNGTFLNGQAVKRDRLRHLDVITLGKEIDLVFVIREAAQVQKVQAIVRAAVVSEGADAVVYEIAPGEITLGRAPSNNLVAEAAAVSKVHCRIERTRDHLVLQDLGSANGTFVNGARVMESFLKDGDTVALGGVATYKVVVEMGEMTLTSGRHSVSDLAAAIGDKGAAKPRFSAEWKTRFEWSSDEREGLAEVRRKLDEREREKEAQRSRLDGAKKQGGKTVAPAKPAAPPVAKAAASAPAKEAAPAPAAKPAAAPAVPPAAAAPPRPPAAPPRPSAAPAPAPPPSPVAKPAPAGPPVVAKPTSATPPRPAAPPEKSSPAAAPPPAKLPVPLKPPVPTALGSPAPAPVPAAASPGPITTVRLTGGGFSLAATQTGVHEIGRSYEAALRIDHPTVSRRHARLILADDRAIVYLQDQGGANGTRLNGKEITKLAPIADGDTIGIGEVTLIVSLVRG